MTSQKVVRDYIHKTSYPVTYSELARAGKCSVRYAADVAKSTARTSQVFGLVKFRWDTRYRVVVFPCDWSVARVLAWVHRRGAYMRYWWYPQELQ